MCSYGGRSSSLLNLPRDECKRILRRLELEAYCSTVSALRAQGDLTNEKKQLLQNLQECLKISAERHGAEVRRAVNDQKLTTVANNLSGPDVSSQWMREGRRLVPIMPRLVPHTAFTTTANHTATKQAEMNKTLNDSSATSAAMNDHSNQFHCENYALKVLRDGSRYNTAERTASGCPSKSTCRALGFKGGLSEEGKGTSSSRSFTPSSLDSNFEPLHVSQSSCVASRQLQEFSVNGDIDSGMTVMDVSESTGATNKRKRENCDDQYVKFHDANMSASLGALKSTCAALSVAETSVQPALVVSSANFSCRPPIKLTVAKPVSRLTYPKQGGPAQKVIIVSGAGVSSAATVCAPPPASFAQKSVVVSVMKTSASVPIPTVVTSFTVNPVTQSTGDTTSGNLFVGSTGSSVSQIVRSAPVSFERGMNACGLSGPHMPNATLGPRLKGLGTRPRTQMIQAAALNHGLHSINNISPSSLHMKPVPLKTTIQIQAEDMKKIITKPINVPSLTAKILPKPLTVVSAITSSGSPSADSSGNSHLFSESGSVSQNLLIVQKLSSALTKSTTTSFTALSNSPKQDRHSDLNFEITKSRPTVVINRLHLGENDKDIFHSVMPSGGSEMRSVTENSDPFLSSSNPVMFSSNVISSVKQNFETIGATRTSNETNVPDQENDSEDLSAITALLSLKMLPTGMEQISPSRDGPDDEVTVITKNDVPEKGRFHNNFIASQRSVILKAVEPKFADEVGGKQPSVGVGCVSALSSDGSTTDLCETKDTSSDTIMKESCEGIVDIQKGQSLQSTVMPVTNDPIISDSQANGNCFKVSDVDNVQSSDAAISYNSLTNNENSSGICSPDGHNAVQLNSHDSANPGTPEKDMMITSLSPILGKRKRRPPKLANEPDPPLPDWCRQALALLSRVMKYRNPHNEKGKACAASWFNSPVSIEEVPDYYDIVRQPMDFSTIKQNLRSGVYDDWTGFHSDMLLVRDNCHLYNADDTDVRHDCDLVFEFYEQEFYKVVNFWKQQQHEHLTDFPFSSTAQRLKVEHAASNDRVVL